MSLILHSGAAQIGYNDLRDLDVPESTRTHVPIPHHRVVDLLRHTLSFYGHDVTDETHAVTEDGQRYFGLMHLRSHYGDVEDTVGLRNSHDKKFPVGLAFGSRVFVCDNLAFFADRVVSRKHTIKAKRDLPSLISEVIEPLADYREQQSRTFQRYKRTQLDERTADHAILTMFRQGIINVQRIDDVVRQWQEPEYEAWCPGSAWHLFNAATYALSGRVAERPSVTSELHQVIDGVCEPA